MRKNGRAAAWGLAAACAGSLGAAGAQAQPFGQWNHAAPDYGLDFVTVGAPGNRDMLPVERYFNINFVPQTVNVGAVAHEFRIMRTEVTAAQWIPFLRAFAPTWGAMGQNVASSFLTSTRINALSFNPANPGYSILPGAERHAVEVGWRPAAYYVNWLHNGAPTHGPGGPGTPVPAAAFTSGAYDTSTFTRNPDGTYNDQIEPSPGARYWIPSLSEWTKAAYYDPGRYAPGNPGPIQGGGPPITGDTAGYWLYPHGSQEEPIYGPPGQGQAGGIEYHSDIALYPDVRSPWGLLDTVGGVTEWTGTPSGITQGPNGPVTTGSRYAMGGRDGSTFANIINDYFLSGGVTSMYGLRVASIVPTPSSMCCSLLMLYAALRRRR